MSKGIDISRYQGEIDWSKVETDFVFIKASQGLAWVDPKFSKNRTGARYKGILKGFYHFADGENPVNEADHFINTCGELEDGDLLILDWEINKPGAGNWCRRFLDRCYHKTGVRPLLYTNEARVKSIDWSEVVAGSYALWVAKYGLNLPVMGATRPSSGQWKQWLIWQYSSRGSVKGINGYVDLNHSDYGIEVLRKYGKQGGVHIPDKAVWPIDKIYITQEFGERPEVYSQFGLEGHNGLDFRTRFVDSPLGKRYILAIMDGEVTEVGDQGSRGYGKFVRLQHKGTEQTVYGHLKYPYVTKGMKVKQGQRIGLSDNTGFSTGPHLHLGWRPDKFNYNNGYLGYDDPLKILPDIPR